jgi:hypothetical protein
MLMPCGYLERTRLIRLLRQLEISTCSRAGARADLRDRSRAMFPRDIDRGYNRVCRNGPRSRPSHAHTHETRHSARSSRPSQGPEMALRTRTCFPRASRLTISARRPASPTCQEPHFPNLASNSSGGLIPKPALELGSRGLSGPKSSNTTTGLNKIQAGGAECTPPRPETDDGSALNVEI